MLNVCITNTKADAISRHNKDFTCKVSKTILKELDENDYIHCKHVCLTIVLSQSLQDNNDLGTSGEECLQMFLRQ